MTTRGRHECSNLTAHADGLRSLARQLVRPQDIEDCLQDTWVAALSAPATPRSPRPWLRQILRNSVRETVRRSQGREALLHLVPSPTPRPLLDERAALDEVARWLDEALQALDEPYRSVVRERFFADRTTVEISHRLGCPHGTVRWQLHEGLRRMRRTLDKRLGERRVCDVMAALAGFPASSAIPASKIFPMSTALLWMSVAAIVGIAAIAYSGFSKPSAPRPSVAATTDVQAVASTSGAADPPLLRSPALTPNARRLPQARRVALDSTHGTAVAFGSADDTIAVMPDAIAVALARLDASRCNERIVAYNVAPDGPQADEHLLEAARCFEAVGLVGRAIQLRRARIRRDPADAEQDRVAMTRLFRQVLDADVGLATELGSQCTSPLLDEGESAAEAYVAAAECLYDGGGLVGAALRMRQNAAADPAGINVGDNGAWIERLEAEAHGLASRIDENSGCEARVAREDESAVR